MLNLYKITISIVYKQSFVVFYISDSDMKFVFVPVNEKRYKHELNGIGILNSYWILFVEPFEMYSKDSKFLC